MKLFIHDLSSNDSKRLLSNMKNDVKIITDDGSIQSCIGCFGCWIKTPAVCVLRDQYQNMGEMLSKCEEVIIVSECVYGGYSPFVKNVLDRSISYIHPYFTIRNKEMHHKRRYKHHFTMKTCFYGKDINKEEMETAEKIVKANAINLDCNQYEVSFFESVKELEDSII